MFPSQCFDWINGLCGFLFPFSDFLAWFHRKLFQDLFLKRLFEIYGYLHLEFCFRRIQMETHCIKKKKYPIRSWWNQKFRWFDWWRESKCQRFGRTFYSPSRHKLLLVLLSSRTAKNTNEMLNQGNKFSITNYLCVAKHHRFKRRNILIYLLDIFLVNLFCAILWTVCLKQARAAPLK